MSMEVASGFTNGHIPPHTIEKNSVTFDLKPGQRILYTRLTGVPEKLTVRLGLDEKGVGFVEGQGLLVSEDNDEYTAVPVIRNGDDLTAEVTCSSGSLMLATRYPYGKKALEKLMTDVLEDRGITAKLVSKEGRAVPFFVIGDDTAAPVHFIIAGEDCWETAGCWTADAMVRKLADDPGLFKDQAFCIVPLVSPYSSDLQNGSYTTPDGKGIYGAATWGDDPPPPEYAVLRDTAAELIGEKRLGCLLTIHSWQAQLDYSGMEAVRTAGDNELSEDRTHWTTQILDALIKDVPRAKCQLSEKIWHPGLARDYLLAKYNAVSFRIEVTTYGQGMDGFTETGEKLLENILSIKDWESVFPVNS